MAEPDVELLQFRYSPYNEKARWALDFKQLAHRRRSLLPGPHKATLKRLTGQTQLPVLRFADQTICGSAQIIAELEQRFPEPPLYPAEPALRRRALEIQAFFDDEVGPKVRSATLSTVLDDSGYVCRMFASDRIALVRACYRAGYPLARGMIKKGNGITDRASVEAAGAATGQALDFVTAEVGASGYLVGENFTVADLTAASLLAPVANPPNSPMTRPEPKPPALSQWLARWADHPGVAWVLDQYRRHRPPSAETV